VEQAIQRWLALHRESWQDKEVTPEHLTRRFGSHMLAAAKRMSKSGLAEIHEFRRGQEVIASDFALLGHGWIGAYLDGANGYARRRYRTSALFTWNLMNLALERGSPTVNLLRGEEEQKLRWNPLIVPNRRLILGRGRDPAFAAYSAWHLMRSRAIEYAKSGHAPDWMNLSGRQLRRFLPV
jgi:hypothetical protein